MYYQTAQYMYMQPYMYPGGVPMASSMMPQQYQYPGQVAAAQGVENYANQMQVTTAETPKPVPQPNVQKPRAPAPARGEDEVAKLNQLKQQAQQWTSQQQPTTEWSSYSSSVPATDVSASITTSAQSDDIIKSHANQGSAEQESVDVEEEEFDRKFNEWEKQFESWKEQNINHPDKEAFSRYEQQWQEWRSQLLQKKEQMQKEKAERLGAKSNQETGSPLVTSSATSSGVSQMPTTTEQMATADSSVAATPAAMTETAMSNPNMYYPTSPYMYMQPYMYPGGIPVAPPVVPQQYPYQGQPTSMDNFPAQNVPTEESKMGGYRPPESKMGGYPPVESKMGYPPPDSKMGGYPPPDPKMSGYPPPDSKMGGYPPPDSKMGGYPPPNMKPEGNQNFEPNRGDQFGYGPGPKNMGPRDQGPDHFNRYDKPDMNMPEFEENFGGRWNAGRGPGRMRGRGMRMRGRGRGRWTDASEMDPPMPAFREPLQKKREKSPPPFEYPTEDCRDTFGADRDPSFSEDPGFPQDNRPPFGEHFDGPRRPFNKRFPPREDFGGFEEEPFHPPFEDFPPFEEERFPPGRFRGRGGHFDDRFDRFHPPPMDDFYGPPDFREQERFWHPNEDMGRGRRPMFDGPPGRGRRPPFFEDRPSARYIDYSHRPASAVLGDDFHPNYEYESQFDNDVTQYRVFDYGHDGERSPVLQDRFYQERYSDRIDRQSSYPDRERGRDWESYKNGKGERMRDRDWDNEKKFSREGHESSVRERDNWDKNKERENKREREWDRDNKDKDTEDRDKRFKFDNKQKDRDSPKERISDVQNSKKSGERDSKISGNSSDQIKPADVRTDVSGETTLIEDLLTLPKRLERPKQLVIILRGLPGSGKTYVAKLIKDKEIENGGSAPRILSLDDYFMVEKEVTEIDPDTGKRVKKKEFTFEYELDMEEVYRTSLFKSFKKTVDDRFFPFIIVDAVHEKNKHYEQYWSYAKQKGFQVYVAEMDCKDPSICHKRNVHKRTLEDITKLLKSWERKPRYYLSMNVCSLLQDAAITNVEMEVESSDKKEEEEEEKDDNDSFKDDENSNSFLHVPSRWEKLEATEEKLDQLDGLRVNKKKHSSMEDYLQLPDDYEERKCEPGKKRVRWADLEERKEQDRLRAIGFVVGQTDWSKLTDPSHADKALTRTKYF